ncbi:helix-turn-helix transcriptional regulator [Micromonospora sp. WMMA1998]|uniref:helix-turn-helix domain-containing protein n=1 Tax=Micromonospora sp. WMMA1998 TaxID=3015167 RepID=UPI00248CDDBF|nr:helix-turn-helix transcriptional regulator [Micromonospora sp. WMMA1998]WBC13451.1 helix-turn-helix transcriptional regulator [Micromonospora sp. WMMA1998]
MTQPNWSARLVRSIASEVKRHREAQDMSAQRLADRCAELGQPIPRSVLANLESGRREALSVPELLVLAEALGVPPIALLVPVGHADQVEALPGVSVSTSDALAWLTGDKPLPGAEWPTGGPSLAVALYRSHRRFFTEWTRWREREQQIRLGAIEGTEADAEQLRQAAADVARSIHLMRVTMMEQGIRPPQDVPAEIAALDGADL